MATTLDHISGGRAILGIGGAWFEEEAEAFGFDFGSGPGQRLAWLAEALPVLRGMLDGTEPTAAGPRYRSARTRNLPAPLQSHLPILIGGGGERVTLRLVARWADLSNIGGDLETVRHKEQVLAQHCREVGRDPADIERTISVGSVVIRDDPAEAERVGRAVFAANRAPDWKHQHGSPEQIAQRLSPYLRLGYRHFMANFPAPYDAESIEWPVAAVRQSQALVG